jgi:carboxymethylenebutenolidase
MPISGGMVLIDSQGVKLPAYVSKPDELKSGTPGIMVLHDRWGLGNYLRAVADKLATAGYVAIAPDLYLGKYATGPDEARKLSSGVSPEVAKKLLDSTDTYLRALDIAKIGIAGFSFGGALALNYVCESKEILAGAIYYATDLPEDAFLERISAPLLIIYGEQDQAVDPDEARGFEKRLKTLGKDARLLLYPSTSHAFFNDEDKQNYRPDEAKDSWTKTLEFFNGRLIQEWQLQPATLSPV